MRVFIEGIGLLGPGLNGWPESRAVLAGQARYIPAPTLLTASDLLPPAERRRMGVPVKLALAVGAAAFTEARRDPATTATVFASSGADSDNVHEICATLATATREVSPTRFHNSVHNAAAGYWSIATRSQQPSTSLCGHDASVAAGLLEAAAQVVVDGRAVALIVYDQPYPFPLRERRPLAACFAAAWVLSAQSGARAQASLDVQFIAEPASATPMADGELESLRVGVPAARCLPLLAALAGRRPTEASTGETIRLAYGEHAHLRVVVCFANSGTK